MPLIESPNLTAEARGTAVVAKFLCHSVSDIEVPQLKTDLTWLAANHRHLAFDLSDVFMVSSAGLGLLIQVRAACEGGGGKLVLACVSEDVAALLRVTQLEKMFPVAASVDEALRLLR